MPWRPLASRQVPLPPDTSLLQKLKWQFALSVQRWTQEYLVTQRPKKIILIRHAQSLGNRDPEIYKQIPDPDIELTTKGHQQAQDAGRHIRDNILTKEERGLIWFFYSPYRRAQQTTANIISQFDKEESRIICTQSPRLREQDFGNLQTAEMEKHKTERLRFGRFWYRFPHGESGSDAYERVAAFQESAFGHMNKSVMRPGYGPAADTYICVSHGLAMRLFLMRKFHWSVEDFDEVWNPRNCEAWVLERDPDDPRGEYQIATQTIRYGGTERAPNYLPESMKTDVLWRDVDCSWDYADMLRSLEHLRGQLSLVT